MIAMDDQEDIDFITAIVKKVLKGFIEELKLPILVSEEVLTNKIREVVREELLEDCLPTPPQQQAEEGVDNATTPQSGGSSVASTNFPSGDIFNASFSSLDLTDLDLNCSKFTSSASSDSTEAVPFISADVSSGVQHTSPICVNLSDTPPSNIKKCLSFESVSTVEGTEVSVENTSRQPVSTGELSPEKSEIRDSEVSPSDTPPSNIKKYLSFESVSTVEGTEVSVENTSRQPVSTGELSPEKSEIRDSEVSPSDTPPSNIKKCLSFESVSTVEGTEVSVENTSRQPVSTGELSPEKSEIRDSEVSPSDTPPSNIKKYLSFESVSTVEGTEVSVENTSRQPVSTGELSPEKSEIGDSEVISLETATATPIAISSEEDKGETDSDSDDADNKLEMLFKRTRHYIENGRKPKIEPVLSMNDFIDDSFQKDIAIHLADSPISLIEISDESVVMDMQNLSLNSLPDESVYFTPMSNAKDLEKHQLISTRIESPPPTPQDDAVYQQYEELLTDCAQRTHKTNRRSIYAFIHSNDCGEVLQEDLIGEGESEKGIFDERDKQNAVVLQHIQTPPNESQRDAITASKWTTASKNFTWTRAQRDKLTSHYFKQFNMAVFSGQFPKDIPIIWNARMTKTAGVCIYKKCEGVCSVEIQLSPKVVDCEDRLRETLLHELCHAAVWLIDKLRDGHGPYWRAWVLKANTVFPDVTITTRHTYQIKTKYQYMCTKCDYVIGRHSKSIDLENSICPFCKSLLVLQNSDGTPYAPRKPTAFAAFVQENYSSVKQSLPLGTPHKDVMRILSSNYKEKKQLNV